MRRSSPSAAGNPSVSSRPCPGHSPSRSRTWSPVPLAPCRRGGMGDGRLARRGGARRVRGLRVASLIDSSVLVDVERGRTDLAALLEERGDRGVAMAAITAADLLHGVHRLRVSKRKTRTDALVERLLAAIPVIAFDLVCARAHTVPRCGVRAPRHHRRDPRSHDRGDLGGSGILHHHARPAKLSANPRARVRSPPLTPGATASRADALSEEPATPNS